MVSGVPLLSMSPKGLVDPEFKFFCFDLTFFRYVFLRELECRKWKINVDQ